MSTTQETAREGRVTVASMAVTLLDFAGTVPVADAIRILADRAQVARSTAADGIRLAVNNRRIRTLRLPAGEWAIGRASKGGVR